MITKGTVLHQTETCPAVVWARRSAMVLFLASIALTIEAYGQADNVTLDLGKVYGDVAFTGSYLAGNPISGYPPDSPASLLPVRLYSGGSLAATRLYSPANDSADPSRYICATYVVNPPVSPDGTRFVAEVNPILFADGAHYRFGSLEPTSSAYKQCDIALPTTTAPEGTRCDLSECPTLVHARIQLKGSEADLDALVDEGVTCRVTASVEEADGSNSYQWQADNARGNLSVSMLRGEGAVVPLLVRGDGSRVILAARCLAAVKPEEPGFAIDPGEARAPFAGQVRLGRLDCTHPDAGDAVIELPVDRIAGSVHGLMDLPGQQIDAAMVEVFPPPSPAGYDWFAGPPHRILPPLSGPDAQHPAPWLISGVAEGQNYRVQATALLDGRGAVLRYPSWPIDIVRLADTPTGHTLVSRPAMRVDGRVRLFDPSGSAGLADLVLQPFNGNAIYWAEGGATSHVGAEGRTQFIDSPSQSCDWRTGGGGAFSLGRLLGAYDPAARQADLRFDLPLVGLSPQAGPDNGLQACPAPWEVSRLILNFDGDASSARRNLSIALGRYSAHSTPAPPLDPGSLTSVTNPDVDLCVGHLKVGLKSADPGLRFRPWAMFSIDRNDGLALAPTTGYPYTFLNGYTQTQPYDFGEPVTELNLTATVPEGTRYWLRGFAAIVPENDPTAPPTYVWPEAFVMPQTGYLGCGEHVQSCVAVQHGGATTQLDISFSGDMPFCRADGNVSLLVHVNSHGVNVERFGYILDPDGDATGLDDAPGTVTPCSSNCGVDPSYTITLAHLAPGAHRLVVAAAAANTCTARRDYSFEIQAAPLQLQCPAPFTVDVPDGVTQLPATDPAIASHLVPTFAGGCSIKPQVSNDVPAIFYLGDTNVEFWIAEPSQECSTVVTVRQRPTVVSYAEKTQGGAQIKSVRVGDGETEWVRPLTSYPACLEYDDTGARLGVGMYESRRGTIRVLAGESGAQKFIAELGSGQPLRLAFAPSGGGLAVLATASSARYRLHWYKTSASGAFQKIPVSVALPSEMPRIEFAEIAWSPDGSRLGLVYSHAGENPGISFLEWRASGATLVLARSIGPLQTHLAALKIHELQYGADGPGFSSVQGLFKIERNAIVRLARVPNDDLDVIRGKPSGGFIEGGRLALLEGLGPHGVPQVLQGPELNENLKEGVATAGRLDFVAVALGAVVRVYRVPSFDPVLTIPASNPRLITFKPRQAPAQ